MMVNTALFATLKNQWQKLPFGTNQSGAPAYELTPHHQLAQLAMTGCLTPTFYVTAQAQLDQVLELAKQVPPQFIAQLAVYAREHGRMKDMPALLLAVLASRDVALMTQVFGRVIDNGKMLRNFVQIVRSGVTGRRSFGSRPKKLIQNWLSTATEAQLLNAAVGSSPSLADVVKMVHPQPVEPWRNAWLAWLIGRPYQWQDLPLATRAFEQFKQATAQGETALVPTDVKLPFQLLTSAPLNAAQWAVIAEQGSWQFVRQSLATLARHGVFEQPGMTLKVAQKLANPTLVARAKAQPFQLMAAYQACGKTIPDEVREALQAAMEQAVGNIPKWEGRVVVCPDVSGSMSSAITGGRGSATSTVRCIDVAALMAVAVLKNNPMAKVLPFENKVVELALNPDESVLTNAKRLAQIGGGGTSVSAPIAWLNQQRACVDLVIMVSDNESWVDANRRGATETLVQWRLLKKRCPKAKLVCIDIAPTVTTQAPEGQDMLNIGGFSDVVFDLIDDFYNNRMGPAHWIAEIEKIKIQPQ